MGPRGAGGDLCCDILKVLLIEGGHVDGKSKAYAVTFGGTELLTGPFVLEPAGPANGKGIGFKASTWNGNTTEFFIKDVTYTGQPASRDIPAYQITGRVVDTLGQPIEGAEVTVGGLSAVTGADGLFALQGIVAGAYTLEVNLGCL